MKRFFHCFVLIMALLLPLTSLIKPTFAMAEDNCGQVLMYDDGSYIIITIEDHRLLDDSSVFATKSTKSGSRITVIMIALISLCGYFVYTELLSMTE